MAPKRTGFRWTINEILSLQREYELLEMSVQEIASKHKRSVESILHKLYAEEITSEWHEARGYNGYESTSKNEIEEDYDIVKPSLSESNESFKTNILNERINNLESSINDIKYTLNTLLRTSSYKNKNKRSPLRKYSTIM
jgi:multidrug efflux pump subunit AcrB